MEKQSKSERSFFQYRSTLLGAVFLLVIIVLNIGFSIKIVTYLEKNPGIIDIRSSIIFSGLSLLSLTSFGFLFNQFWYVTNNIISRNCFYTQNDPRIRYIVGTDYDDIPWTERARI